MFTADEFQLIRSNCPADLETLLKQMSIAIPNFAEGDEFKTYEKLSNAITNKLCMQMKSESVIGGYAKLLKIGKVDYDMSETDHELLTKILKNKQQIMQDQQTVQIAKQAKEEIPIKQQAATKTVTKTEHSTIMPAVILGIVLIVVSVVNLIAFDSGLAFIILLLAGILSTMLGLRGTNKKVAVQVPVADQSPHTTQSPQATIQTSKVEFTQAELQEIMNTLTQVNKIVKAI